MKHGPRFRTVVLMSQRGIPDMQLWLTARLVTALFALHSTEGMHDQTEIHCFDGMAWLGKAKGGKR